MKPLTEEDLSSIYKNIIKPGLFDKIKKSDKKTCVFLGGQPGSGKSYLNDITINTLANQSAVVIDSDLIRKHHPYNPLIAEKDIYSLDEDCYKWGEMLIKDSIKEHKNVVFDGTFGGNMAHTYKLLERFRENGYNTKLNLLATNDIVSKIGFNWRYQHQKKLTGYGRPVDMLYHNQIYERILDNLHKTLPLNLINEFNIYGRDHVTKKINLCHTYGAEELKLNPGKAITDYENERNRKFTSQEIKELNNWYIKTSKLVEENKGDLQMFQESIQTYDTKASLQLKEQIKIITNAGESKLHVSGAKQLEPDILKGYLGSDPKIITAKLSYGSSKVATFALAENPNSEKANWQNVQIWGRDIPENRLKKGDYVELQGYYKTFDAVSGKKEEFVATQVTQHRQKQVERTKQQETIKGNLGQDPVFQKSKEGHDVAAFSVGYKNDNKETSWQNVQVWKNNIEKLKIRELKKGDFVELGGYYGKSYTNKEGIVKKDLILERCMVLKHSEKEEVKRNKGKQASLF